MNIKKFFKSTTSLLLVLSILMCMMPLAVIAADEATTITDYISISKYGEFVTGKDNKTIAAAPVELDGKSSYTIDDVLNAAHNLYYDGTDGYASSVGDYGLSLTKLWGDTSGLFGYQMNCGTVNVMGLTQPVSDGDYIDAYINESAYPNNEAYAHFGKNTAFAGVGKSLTLTLSSATGYDDNWNTVYSGCADAAITINGEVANITTDSEGNASLIFDSVGTYIVSANKTKTVSETEVTAITAPICVVSVAEYDTAITVPSNAELFVGSKGKVHYVPFTEIEPSDSLINEKDATTTYYFELTDNSVYNYRISSDEYVTYGATFKKTPNFEMNVTTEMLAADGRTKTTVERDKTANNNSNVADIYLNINAQGYLKLASVGDTYQIIPLRNWQALVSSGDNYFIEPDFHYTVIDESGNLSDSVVTVNDSGLLTAVGEGSAIVLVTYDALNIPTLSDPFFGAIWPENTGVFAVSVGLGDSGIQTGITVNTGLNNAEYKLSGDMLDSEHDVIYFMGDSGEYTFTPADEGCTVSVANPTVDTAMTFSGFEAVAANEDGSCIIPLVEGRNIVKLEKDGKAEYQVITSKKLNVTINNGNEVKRGDSVSIVFDTIYHPANKLAGIYNMFALPIYTEVSAYDNKLVGGLPSQYTFASSSETQTISNILPEGTTSWGSLDYTAEGTLTIPVDFTGDTFTLSGGKIRVYYYGDPFGNHRGVTLESGKAPNLNADEKVAWLGVLPDIEIPIKKSTTQGSTSSSNITVKVTVLGDEKHGTPSGTSDTHTLKVGTLDTWLEETSVTVPKGSTALDAVEKVLKAANISYSNPSGDYIESINGLAEFDNGTYSGWMYTINGEYSSIGLSNQKLNSGDKIVLHYTDNYNKEKTTSPGTSSNRPSSSSNSSSSSSGSYSGSTSVSTQTTAAQNTFSEDTFDDIKSDDWHYDAVKYVYENKLMNGTGSGFEPDTAMTRAMLVTVLYRLENPSESNAKNAFADVSDGEWYTDAIGWAAENGLVKGVSDTEFAPNDNVTREQMAAIIYRYAELKGYDITDSADISQYADANEVSDWALDAIKWTNAAELVKGTSDTALSPQDTATRAQVSAIIMRFCENVVK